MSEPLLTLGASVEAIQAARNSIITILEAGRADNVTIEALSTLQELCSVKNTTIRNCHFTNAAADPDISEL